LVGEIKMKNFIVTDKTTGKALRTGCCPDDMVELQVNGSNEQVTVVNEKVFEKEE